jgi:hypothetical protein
MLLNVIEIKALAESLIGASFHPYQRNKMAEFNRCIKNSSVETHFGKFVFDWFILTLIRPQHGGLGE